MSSGVQARPSVLGCDGMHRLLCALPSRLAQHEQRLHRGGFLVGSQCVALVFKELNKLFRFGLMNYQLWICCTLHYKTMVWLQGSVDRPVTRENMLGCYTDWKECVLGFFTTRNFKNLAALSLLPLPTCKKWRTAEWMFAKVHIGKLATIC
jgi:hypothetical protein